MKLTKEDISDLVSSGRIDGMPDGMFVAGFDDIDGKYYPIAVLDGAYAGCECCLYTYLIKALGGVEFYLHFE